MKIILLVIVMLGRATSSSRTRLLANGIMTGLSYIPSECFATSKNGQGKDKDKMLRNRALSAPPRLTDQRPNPLTQLPPPLVADHDASWFRIGPPILRSDEAPTPRGVIVVYTDGSCHGNYASAVGIYFGKDHPLNHGQALPGPIHSSVFAELQAALIALDRLYAWQGYGGQRVIVRSDCKAIVDTLRTGSFSDPRYTAELSRLRLAAERFPQGVQFEHIYGHNGHPGNDEADRLATEANRNSRSRARSMSVNRRRSRSRSRNGRGAPDSTVFVPPKPISNELVIPPPASVRQQSARQVQTEQTARQSRSRSVRRRSRSRSKIRQAPNVNATQASVEAAVPSVETRQSRSRSRVKRTPTPAPNKKKSVRQVIPEPKTARQSRSRSVNAKPASVRQMMPEPKTARQSRSRSVNAKPASVRQVMPEPKTARQSRSRSVQSRQSQPRSVQSRRSVRSRSSRRK